MEVTPRQSFDDGVEGSPSTVKLHKLSEDALTHQSAKAYEEAVLSRVAKSGRGDRSAVPFEPPFAVKRKPSLTKEGLEQRKLQRERVKETLQARGFVPGASDLTSPKKTPKLKLRSSMSQEDIFREFPDLIDADAEALSKMQEVQDTLLRTEHDDLNERRRIFRTLCFQWHASRHDGTPSERWADRVFQFLMQQRDWYLATAQVSYSDPAPKSKRSPWAK